MTEEKQTYTSKDKQELHKAADTPLTTKDLLFKIMEDGGVTCSLLRTPSTVCWRRNMVWKGRLTGSNSERKL